MHRSRVSWYFGYSWGIGPLSRPPVGSWARSRISLQQILIISAASPGNAESLDKIESALFVICLDAPFDVPDSKLSAVGRQLLHGGGSNVNTGNRWFDKCIQVKHSGIFHLWLLTDFLLVCCRIRWWMRLDVRTQSCWRWGKSWGRPLGDTVAHLSFRSTSGVPTGLQHRLHFVSLPFYHGIVQGWLLSILAKAIRPEKTQRVKWIFQSNWNSFCLKTIEIGFEKLLRKLISKDFFKLLYSNSSIRVSDSSTIPSCVFYHSIISERTCRNRKRSARIVSCN